MIEMKDLCFSYERKKPFIEGLSGCMQDGQITALAGPNGAGKSTALRLCAHLLTPASGSIRMDGADVRRMDPRAFAHVASFLPQSRPVPMISVEALVMHGRYAFTGMLGAPGESDRRAVRRALEMTGLQALAGRGLHTLSGGQRQKAYLAMLIAQEAKHILLDEPLTYLDAACQLEVMHILEMLRQEGRCIVMVLHDLALIPEWCDRAMVMHAGKLIFDGPAQEMVSSGAIEEAFGVRPVLKQRLAFEKE